MANSPSPAVRKDPIRVSRLTRLLQITGGTRYLEIGVSKGTTFFRIPAPEKVAVDPVFQFELADHAAPGVAFHPVTSDAYFADLAPDAVFDVIYLDGLHHFQQTYRDLCNALLHIQPGSAMLIDDTLPTSTLSAGRDQQAVWAAYAAGELPNNAWHGDVYKVILAIHDFHPGLNYVTLTTRNHGQTLVWRSPNFRRTPRFDAFAAIEALDFDSLQAELPLLRPMADAEALALFEADLRALGRLPNPATVGVASDAPVARKKRRPHRRGGKARQAPAAVTAEQPGAALA